MKILRYIWINYYYYYYYYYYYMNCGYQYNLWSYYYWYCTFCFIQPRDRIVWAITWDCEFCSHRLLCIKIEIQINLTPPVHFFFKSKCNMDLYIFYYLYFLEQGYKINLILINCSSKFRNTINRCTVIYRFVGGGVGGIHRDAI